MLWGNGAAPNSQESGSQAEQGRDASGAAAPAFPPQHGPIPPYPLNQAPTPPYPGRIGSPPHQQLEARAPSAYPDGTPAPLPYSVLTRGTAGVGADSPGSQAGRVRPPRPPRSPRSRHGGRGWRRVLLAGLVVVLVAGSLGVLLAQKSASDRAATAAQMARAHATQTAVAQIVHFPYHAAAPGPVCDKGNAPWMLAGQTTQNDLTCAPTHTRITGVNVGIKWLGNLDENSSLPQSYTVSVQVSNVHASGGVPVAATLGIETSAAPSIMSYSASGDVLGSMCTQQTCNSGRYHVNPSGPHTLSMTVNGTRLSMAVDSHAIATITGQSLIETQSIDLAISFDAMNYATLSTSADFANFTVSP